MSNTYKRINFFRDISKFVLLAKDKGIDLLPTSFIRTPEEQLKLVTEGKSKTLKSKHLVGLAIDFVIVKDNKPVWDYVSEYDILGELWISLGGIWGGQWKNFRDIYHFESK